jgi:Asp-tRNA(Asn)/Glu-tRNA(Gln) amidotransferase B subunit
LIGELLNGPAAKEVFETIASEGGEPVELVKSKGLEQIGSVDELELIG